MARTALGRERSAGRSASALAQGASGRRSAMKPKFAKKLWKKEVMPSGRLVFSSSRDLGLAAFDSKDQDMPERDTMGATKSLHELPSSCTDR